MISFLLNTRRLSNKIVQLKPSIVRQVHKGPEGIPPMRFISTTASFFIKFC